MPSGASPVRSSATHLHLWCLFCCSLVDDAAGTALKVALIDTGVDAKSFYQHFSEDRCRCKLYCFDVTKPTPGEWIVERVGDAASDASGHATHLASIIAQVACTDLAELMGI